MNYKLLNKRQRKPKKQSRMDNPETLAKIRHKTGNEDKQNSYLCYLFNNVLSLSVSSNEMRLTRNIK
jgi:hypothetical protein